MLFLSYFLYPEPPAFSFLRLLSTPVIAYLKVYTLTR